MYTAVGGYYMDGNSFAKNKNKRVNKVSRARKVHLSIFFTLIICSFLFGALVHAYATSEDSLTQLNSELAPVYETHIVDKGQSLWKIARIYVPADKDIRKYIFEIKLINQLETSILQEGQKLLLPNL